MIDTKKIDAVNRNLEFLAPVFRQKVERALAGAALDGHAIAVFEGWRSPARQDDLYAQGRTLPGRVITKARAWESLHNFGLAVDIANLPAARMWNWNGDFKKYSKYFTGEGLKWLSPFEQVHYELPTKFTLAQMREIVNYGGLPALWGSL